MLLIAVVEGQSGGTTLRLEGEIIGPWVEELRTVCTRQMAHRSALTLDLAEVTFIDRLGVQLLQTLRTRGIHLSNCSGFVAGQLTA